MRGFKRRILWSLTLTVALGTVGGAQAQLRYRVEAVGVLGPDNADSFSGAYGVNNHGTVAGFAGSMSNSIPQQAIVYENGQARSLGTLKGLVTVEAQDINDRGQIVGYASSADTGESRPFFYDKGQLKDLNPLAGFSHSAYAWALNHSGHAVGAINGQAYVSDGTLPRLIPFESSVKASTAWAINDHGVAVGRTEYKDAVSRAFVWDGSTLSYLPIPQGAPEWLVEGVDINNAGQIVVKAGDRAYLYDGGTYQNLGTLSGLSTTVRAINEKGWIVGGSAVEGTPSQPYRAYLWRSGRMRDLNDLLDPDAAQHWKLYDAMDINDRGQIVGMGMVDGLTRGFIATPVPEAGTWALMLAGLGGVGAVAWRRRSDVPARHLTAPYQ